jgi:hypothetical protein
LLTRLKTLLTAMMCSNAGFGDLDLAGELLMQR